MYAIQSLLYTPSSVICGAQFGLLSGEPGARRWRSPGKDIELVQPPKPWSSFPSGLGQAMAPGSGTDVAAAVLLPAVSSRPASATQFDPASLFHSVLDP